MNEAKWRTAYDDLKYRITEGTWPVGQLLPPISQLQSYYEVASPNTIRQAQQRLVADGLIETEQGVGARVVSTEATTRTVDILEELKAARKALDRAIRAVEKS